MAVPHPPQTRNGDGQRQGLLPSAGSPIAYVGSTLEMQTAPQATNTGVGLRAKFYNGTSPDGYPVTARLDSQVNFVWAGSPATGVNADYFSAHWSGLVEAQYTEAYTFYTYSDSGVQLWINGQRVIMNWTDHALTWNSSQSINLMAGEQVAIVLEYYEKGGGSTIRLERSSPSTPQAIVPSSQLYSGTAGLRKLEAVLLPGREPDR